MPPRKVIITTDPGQDQAAAILMMLGQPEMFDVLGLVAVAGNIHLSHTISNCLKLLELAGRPDIPVAVGCATPILRDLVIADHVHGPTGLDGPILPDPTSTALDKQGWEFIVETIRREPPGTVTIASISPMTNLALALIMAPDIACCIQEVVAMAGAYFEVGNISPAAEFNVFVDPEAADKVLSSGVKITLLPLDVTHKVLSTAGRLEAMRAVGTKSAIATAAMLQFSEAFDLKKYGWNGAPLHSPCVPMFITEPEQFQGRHVNVAVETKSEITRGMTVADWWGITGLPKNAFWVRDCDDERLYELLNIALSRLP